MAIKILNSQHTSIAVQESYHCNRVFKRIDPILVHGKGCSDLPLNFSKRVLHGTFNVIDFKFRLGPLCCVTRVVLAQIFQLVS